MTSCLAVDPGERAGWAVHLGSELGPSGVVDGSSLTGSLSILDRYQTLDALVIEDQYFPRNRGAKGLKTLFYRRYLWQIPAEWVGMQIVVVHPSTWQSYFKIRRGDKLGIRPLAESLACRDIEPDEADAVLMAYWYAATSASKEET